MDHGQTIPKATAINRAAVNIAGLDTSEPIAHSDFGPSPMTKFSETFSPAKLEPSRIPHDGATSRSDGVFSEPPPTAVFAPQVRLLGRIDEVLVTSFHQQMANLPVSDEAVAVELMTMGGDAEMGRRLALEIRLARERLNRRVVFIGKTTVYSAGVTAMAGFPREDRYLTRDAVLLIHCRQLEQTLQLSGPLRANAQRIREVREQIEFGLQVEQEGFAALIEGSNVTLEEVNERAATNWYVAAGEAAKLKLVAGVV